MGINRFKRYAWTLALVGLASIWSPRLRAEIAADTALDGSAIPEVKDLEAYPSVQAFEDAISAREQACLDGSYGGSAAGECPVATEAWEGEVERFADRLRSRLPKADQTLLDECQASWDDANKSSEPLLQKLSDRVHNADGTMWAGPIAEEWDGMAAPVQKARALMLRAWCALDPLPVPKPSSGSAQLDPQTDAALNRAYQALRSHLDGDEKVALTKTERAWIRARDSAYSMVSAFKNPLAAGRLVDDMVQERIQTLGSWSQMATEETDEQDADAASASDDAQSADVQSPDDVVRHALQLWNSGQQEDAIDAMKAEADKGDLRAAAFEGVFLHYRNNPAPDDETALAEWTRAADGGDAEGCYRLGWAYENGCVLGKNAVEAAVWYRKAADKGHLMALYSLALLSKHPLERKRLLEQAKQGGLALARIALLTDTTPAAKAPEAEVRAWLAQANEAGELSDADWECDVLLRMAADNRPAPFEVIKRIAEQDPMELARGMDLDALKGMGLPEDVLVSERHGVGFAQYSLSIRLVKLGGADNRRKALYWLTKSATGGLSQAQLILANDYLLGQLVPSDEDKMAYWARKAADQGVPWAWDLLADQALEKGDPKAETYLLKGIDLGCTLCYMTLGETLQSGLVGDKDVARAEHYFQLGVEHGDPGCMHDLGLLYLGTCGIPPDSSRAEKLLGQSLAAGNAPAGLELGEHFMDGSVLPKNSVKAEAAFEAAEKLGSQLAPMYLAIMAEQGSIPGGPSFAETKVGEAAARGLDSAQAILNLAQDKKLEFQGARLAFLKSELLRMAADKELELGDGAGRLDKSFTYIFSGLINARYPISLGFGVDKSGNLKGAYYYRRFPNNLFTLRGTFVNHHLNASELDPQGNQTGVFDGDMSLIGVLEGTWTKTGDKPLPLTLNLATTKYQIDL